MSTSERQEYTRQLLEMQFEDGNNYTREELDSMSDEELIECFEDESSESDDVDDEIAVETCFACGFIKPCPFEDEDSGQPVCQECADEAQDDEEPIADEDAAPAADEEEDDDEDDPEEIEDGEED